MHQEKNHLRCAYLLRCWQEGETAPGQEPRWRFWLEEVMYERRQKGFSNLEALFAFLQAELTSGEKALFDEESYG
jgi:hypothetical protein